MVVSSKDGLSVFIRMDFISKNGLYLQGVTVSQGCISLAWWLYLQSCVFQGLMVFPRFISQGISKVVSLKDELYHLGCICKVVSPKDGLYLRGCICKVVFPRLEWYRRMKAWTPDIILIWEVGPILSLLHGLGRKLELSSNTFFLFNNGLFCQRLYTTSMRNQHHKS